MFEYSECFYAAQNTQTYTNWIVGLAAYRLSPPREEFPPREIA
jgi:hypothetical protein